MISKNLKELREFIICKTCTKEMPFTHLKLYTEMCEVNEHEKGKPFLSKEKIEEMLKGRITVHEKIIENSPTPNSLATPRYFVIQEIKSILGDN